MRRARGGDGQAVGLPTPGGSTIKDLVRRAREEGLLLEIAGTLPGDWDLPVTDLVCRASHKILGGGKERGTNILSAIPLNGDARDGLSPEFNGDITRRGRFLWVYFLN